MAVTTPPEMPKALPRHMLPTCRLAGCPRLAQPQFAGWCCYNCSNATYYGCKPVDVEHGPYCSGKGDWPKPPPTHINHVIRRLEYAEQFIETAKQWIQSFKNKSVVSLKVLTAIMSAFVVVRFLKRLRAR